MPARRFTFAAPLAALTAVAFLVAGCGDNEDTGSGATNAPTSSSTDQTDTPNEATTSSATPNEPDGSGSTLVTAGELDMAVSQVVDFLDALGLGDIEQAATYLGPVSEQRAAEAGGLDALLRESTEGHGSWASTQNRTATPVGIDQGLVAVMLEGDLDVEGSSEHRVEVFPVRKVESTGAWLVEFWAYDLSVGNPIDITAPVVDGEERASADGDIPLDVTVEVPYDGTISLSFDAKAPASVEVTAGEPVTVTAPGAGTSSVVVVYSSGADVAARGFVIVIGSGGGRGDGGDSDGDQGY